MAGKGIKYDSSKLRWTLLPFKEVEEVVKVLEHGANKYESFNWQKVEKKRYIDATLRHLVAYLKGEFLDDEKEGSGLSHLAHAICSLLFVLWHENKERHR